MTPLQSELDNPAIQNVDVFLSRSGTFKLKSRALITLHLIVVRRYDIEIRRMVSSREPGLNRAVRACQSFSAVLFFASTVSYVFDDRPLNAGLRGSVSLWVKEGPSRHGGQSLHFQSRRRPLTGAMTLPSVFERLPLRLLAEDIVLSNLSCHVVMHPCNLITVFVDSTVMDATC